jgi:hypothetical protein
MNTPTASLAAIDTPIYRGPRRLDDDVFQTAEEAVLVEGQGGGAALPLSRSAATDVHDSGRRGLPLGQAVRSYVAEKPCRSALLAAAAGALAMVVLRSQLRGRLSLPRLPRRR